MGAKIKWFKSDFEGKRVPQTDEHFLATSLQTITSIGILNVYNFIMVDISLHSSKKWATEIFREICLLKIKKKVRGK
jgi:hypothetical protein